MFDSAKLNTNPELSKADFETTQEVRWCPGCGDYSILAGMQKIMPTLGIPKENIVFVSGIGCAGRFPYYMNTYGFHTIHGRAPAVATGLKLTRPELSVWVITGDGDGLSIGANHLLHMLRRNIDIKVLLFNNQIYGLTKGQFSPTSEAGKITKTSPAGVIEQPLNPIAFALTAGASFVARVLDIDAKGLQQVIMAAAKHQGSAFIEIYQNCHIFNDGAFAAFSGKAVREDNTVWLEHGEPLIFGKERNKGICLNGLRPEIVELGSPRHSERGEESPSDRLSSRGEIPRCARDDVPNARDDMPNIHDGLLIHNAQEEKPLLAQLLSQFEYPDLPVPMGIFRQIQKPTYETQLSIQEQQATKKAKSLDLASLLNSGETWNVE